MYLWHLDCIHNTMKMIEPFVWVPKHFCILCSFNGVRFCDSLLWAEYREDTIFFAVITQKMTGLNIRFCGFTLLFFLTVYYASKSHNIVAKVIKNNDSSFMWWFFYLLKKWRKKPVVNELDYSHKMCKYFRCFMTFKHQTFSSFWQFHGKFRIYPIWINAKHYSSTKFAQSSCKSSCAFILVASLYFDM